MRKIFREAGAPALLFLVVTGMCTAVFLLYCACVNLRMDAWSLEKDENTIYLTLQHETDPTTLPNLENTLRKLSELYEELSESDQYIYYELYTQPLASSSGSFFDEGTEELTTDACSPLCVQISENVQADFGLTAEQGRLLTADNFHWSAGAEIPVLMGHAYQSVYQLGDTFDADYLFQTYRFVIVGFLKENSQIERSNGTISLDQYIVMPSFTCDSLPQNETEYQSQKIHAANKLSGKIRVSPEKYDAVYALVMAKLDAAYGVGNFSWYSSVFGDTAVLWGMSLKTLRAVSAVVGAGLFFAAV